MAVCKTSMHHIVQSDLKMHNSVQQVDFKPRQFVILIVLSWHINCLFYNMVNSEES